jgi:RimJ/RimL family protein N-acetyltransferase
MAEIPTLETERLRLRPLRESDFEDYAALYADPEVLRYLGSGPEPWDRGRAWRHMAFVRGHWELAGAGMWAVEHKETGAFMGLIGFAAPEGWPGFELGWTLGRDSWGKGYATEGAARALEYAFTEMNRDHVISLIALENHGSIKVAERLGEKVEGETEVLGRRVFIYGISRDQWRDHSGR